MEPPDPTRLNDPEEPNRDPGIRDARDMGPETPVTTQSPFLELRGNGHRYRRDGPLKRAALSSGPAGSSRTSPAAPCTGRRSTSLTRQTMPGGSRPTARSLVHAPSRPGWREIPVQNSVVALERVAHTLSSWKQQLRQEIQKNTRSIHSEPGGSAISFRDPISGNRDGYAQQVRAGVRGLDRRRKETSNATRVIPRMTHVEI